ncbi:hypothetical protein [Olivibacter jilunii]|uniref:hypothetical protein n=1 Tax=Olivibacter jilunii TaxID=985016 RepID=UPI003F147072
MNIRFIATVSSCALKARISMTGLGFGQLINVVSEGALGGKNITGTPLTLKGFMLADSFERISISGVSANTFGSCLESHG